MREGAGDPGRSPSSCSTHRKAVTTIASQRDIGNIISPIGTELPRPPEKLSRRTQHHAKDRGDLIPPRPFTAGNPTDARPPPAPPSDLPKSRYRFVQRNAIPNMHTPAVRPTRPGGLDVGGGVEQVEAPLAQANRSSRPAPFSSTCGAVSTACEGAQLVLASGEVFAMARRRLDDYAHGDRVKSAGHRFRWTP